MEYVHAEGEPDFDELCEIVGEIAQRYGIVRVYLFGSRARGDNFEGSDYDFCIMPPEGFGGFKLNGFFRSLREALDSNVDVITERCLKDDDFSKEILRDRRLVYEA